MTTPLMRFSFYAALVLVAPWTASAITTADSAVMIAFPDLVPYGGTVGQTLSFNFEAAELKSSS